ncbi:hypothetical protein WM42_2053 [Corynebacterium simulans]|nr:hypothetical protein WM42_2053 [Corynebacterium simulans]
MGGSEKSLYFVIFFIAEIQFNEAQEPSQDGLACGRAL